MTSPLGTVGELRAMLAHHHITLPARAQRWLRVWRQGTPTDWRGGAELSLSDGTWATLDAEYYDPGIGALEPDINTITVTRHTTRPTLDGALPWEPITATTLTLERGVSISYGEAGIMDGEREIEVMLDAAGDAWDADGEPHDLTRWDEASIELLDAPPIIRPMGVPAR